MKILQIYLKKFCEYQTRRTLIENTLTLWQTPLLGPLRVSRIMAPSGKQYQKYASKKERKNVKLHPEI
jgi:hypothetical protein